MGILNCFNHFALPASTTVLLNLSIIAFSTAVVWRYFHSRRYRWRWGAGRRSAAIPHPDTANGQTRHAL